MKRTENTMTLKSKHDGQEYMLVRQVAKTDDSAAAVIGKHAALVENFPKAMKSQRGMIEALRPKLLFLTHPEGNRAARRAAKRKTS